MGVKFRRDSDECICGKKVERMASDWTVCMRTAEHTGKCVSLARDAAIADGVCAWCRLAVGHRADCDAPDIDWNRNWAKRVRRACAKGKISPLEKKRMLDKLEFDSLAASASDNAASRVR